MACTRRAAPGGTTGAGTSAEDGAMPPVAAVAALGTARATSESSVAVSFVDARIGASSAGGGFHRRYRHGPEGLEVLQGAAHFVPVWKDEVNVRASGLTAVSVTAVVTRSLSKRLRLSLLFGLSVA